jgi:hypothetical protein
MTTKLADLTAEQLVRHVAHLADAVGRQGATDLVGELADAAKLLQYRYDAPAWQGQNGTRPDNDGDDRVDLMRRVTWEGNGFLAVTAGEIRRTYHTDVAPLERNLAGHNLLTLPRELPADDTPVLLYSGLRQIGSLLSVTLEDGEASVDRDLVDVVRSSRLPHPHPMDF